MRKRVILFGFLPLLMGAQGDGCGSYDPPKSASGVSKASVKVPVGEDGLTAEQWNVRERVRRDNLPGSIKHLYVISAYSGQVLIYSTVKRKSSSSGKRLTPTTVTDVYSGQSGVGFPVDVGGDTAFTQEVLQDDGTYGSSGDYIYWFDVNGVYHQHYVAGGQIVHISDQPLRVPHIVINMETSTVTEGANPGAPAP